MIQAINKIDIFQQLQKQIHTLQGFRTPTESQRVDFGLGIIERSFTGNIFPTGAIHELISAGREDAAATTGFMAGLLGKMMQRGGICLWISQKRTLFPPALKFFGIDPDRVVFIDVKNEKDLLWMVEESLKCQALSAVVGELKELNLTESRRLQLAVEQSRVTGLLHRLNPRRIENTACTARWKITPLASSLDPEMPGMGFARWNIELLKARNGEPGQWQLQWINGSFDYSAVKPSILSDEDQLLKAG
ncbi:ImuA family protein [Dyadobacter psychrotolerans]|uniref:Error-prone repair protein ImuA n=1 Tax=Dyadobacter psychrotolerans TaxID=2541721 RepID=A0A4R5E253_9BACT|nr:Error-prone repair protein ImuA [Dyadobacter psychrotolerans]TDE18083.1 Error-prone repair protein ImuA [Dyadobacter psychrotolerans]